MTREELCRDVFKRAFYHAYNNYLLNDERSKCTICHVKHNRVFFYDSAIPKFYFDGCHNNEYYISFIITADMFSSIASMGKEMVASINNTEDKAVYDKFITDLKKRATFLKHNIYVESFYFIKQNLRHVWESYVEYVVDKAWFTCITKKKDIFDREISLMVKAFYDCPRMIQPKQYKELLGLILDNANIKHDLDKLFIECRSDIIHIITDSGVLETAE